MTIDFIDPHVHFFALATGEYAWLKPDNPPFWKDKNLIHNDYCESDLSVNAPLNLSAYVHVEAGFDNENSLREAEYWLEKATLPMTAMIFADLRVSPERFRQSLMLALALNGAPQQERNAFFAKPITGIRHIFDDETCNILSSDNMDENFSLLDELGLLFELKMNMANSNDFSALMKVLEKYPSLRLSVNHAGGFNGAHNRISTKELNDWRQNMRHLCELNNAYVKVSGFEMQDRNYTIDHVKRSLDDTLNVAGEENVMFASNFPLTLFSATYSSYWQLVIEAIDSMGLKRSPLIHDTAKRCYFG